MISLIQVMLSLMAAVFPTRIDLVIIGNTAHCPSGVVPPLIDPSSKIREV